jgi:hypothetical protein
MGNNSIAINQLQRLYVLVKEAVVPKEFKHLKRIGCSRRPVGLPLQTNIAKWGFLSY